MDEKQKNKNLLEDDWYKRVEENGEKIWKQIDESEIADKKHEVSDWCHEFNFELDVDYLKVWKRGGIREATLHRKRSPIKISYANNPKNNPNKNKKYARILMYKQNRDDLSCVRWEEYFQQRHYALVIDGKELKCSDTLFGSCEEYLDEKGLEKLETIAAKYAKTMKEEGVEEFSIDGGRVEIGFREPYTPGSFETEVKKNIEEN